MVTTLDISKTLVQRGTTKHTVANSNGKGLHYTEELKCKYMPF